MVIVPTLTILSYFRTQTLSYPNLWVPHIDTPWSCMRDLRCRILGGTWKVTNRKDFQVNKTSQSQISYYYTNKLCSFNYWGQSLFIED